MSDAIGEVKFANAGVPANLEERAKYWQKRAIDATQDREKACVALGAVATQAKDKAWIMPDGQTVYNFCQASLR